MISHGDVFICNIFLLWESHRTEERHSIWNQVDMRSNLSFNTDFESYRISLRQSIYLSIRFLSLSHNIMSASFLKKCLSLSCSSLLFFCHSCLILDNYHI